MGNLGPAWLRMSRFAYMEISHLPAAVSEAPETSDHEGT